MRQTRDFGRTYGRQTNLLLKDVERSPKDNKQVYVTLLFSLLGKLNTNSPERVTCVQTTTGMFYKVNNLNHATALYF